MATKPLFVPDFVPAPPVAKPDLKLVPPPRVPEVPEQLSFDLPRGLHALMAGAFTLFTGLITATFLGGEYMGLVAAICFVCLLGYFGLPYLMTTTRGAKPARRVTFSRFMTEGVDHGGGQRTHAGEAVGLVMLLPAVLLLWAVAIAVIHTSVM